MKEEQQDFFKELGQESPNIEHEKIIYELAREVVRNITDKSSIENFVKNFVKEKGANPDDIPAICKLVENTLIDYGDDGKEYWNK